METTSDTDQSLVQQLELECTYNAAAAAIFERYMRQLSALIQYNLPAAVQQRVDPEDVSQSTWRSFFRCHEGFDIADSLFPILAQIAKRKVSRAIRRNTAEKRDMRREASGSEQFDIETLRTMNDGSTESESLSVAEAIGKLPGELQEIVVRRMDGYSYEEVARLLGVTKRTIHRKKVIIQGLLNEILNEDLSPDLR